MPKLESIKQNNEDLYNKWNCPLFNKLNYKHKYNKIENNYVITIKINDKGLLYWMSESEEKKGDLAYNEDKDYYVANIGDVYDQEKIYIYTDKEYEERIGYFIAKTGKKDYQLENDNLTFGISENTSLFDTNLFETKKTEEIEYVNITKDEYENMKAKINLLMSLLK
jgi:hypothetical protein